MNHPTAKVINLFFIVLAGFGILLPGKITITLAFSGVRATQIDSQNSNLILFKRGPLNTETQRDLDTSSEDKGEFSITAASDKKQLRVVQFAGPIKNAWFEALTATGAQVLGYVPNNAYIIHGTKHSLARVAQLDSGTGAAEEKPVRWMGRQ